LKPNRKSFALATLETMQPNYPISDWAILMEPLAHMVVDTITDTNMKYLNDSLTFAIFMTVFVYSMLGLLLSLGKFVETHGL